MEDFFISSKRRWFVVLMILGATGCGTLREQGATDQLLLSDAVDRCMGWRQTAG